MRGPSPQGTIVTGFERDYGRSGMDWWQWLVVVLGVLVLLTAVVYGIQVRRRRGGIVAQRRNKL